MFCTKCGNPIPDGAKFCTKCGAAVDEAFVRPAASDTPNPVGNAYADNAGFGESGEYGGGFRAEPEKKKKKFPFWIIGVVAAVVVAVVALSIFTGLGNFFARTFSSPEKYYHYIEKQTVSDMATDLAEIYGSELRPVLDQEKKQTTSDISVDLNDDAVKLLETFTGEDFGWLKTVGISTTASHVGDQSELNMALKFGKDQLLSYDLIFDEDDMMIYCRVPELSEDYFEIDAAELMDDVGYGYYDDDDLSEGFAMLEKLNDAAPDQKTVETILTRYLTLALDQIDDVEKGQKKLSAQGVSANYTALTVTIDSDTLEDIINAVCDALEDDKDVKKLLENMEDALDLDLYDDFLDEVEWLSKHAGDYASYLDEEIVMTVYVDGKGAVCGRSIVYDETEILYARPVSGGKFGFKFSYDDGWDTFAVTGSGKCTGDVYTGEFTLEYEDEALLNFSLDKFDVGKLKKGSFKGGVTLKPTPALLEEFDLDSSTAKLVKNMAIRFDLDTDSKGGKVVCSLLNGEDAMLSITLNGNTGTAKSIASVKNSEDVYDWAEDILSGDALEDWVDGLRDTDIPDDYLDMLEYLPNMF